MKVEPGSRLHSSFSSARRYLARIFVACSTSVMSILARMRASRRVDPISGMATRRLSRLYNAVSSPAGGGSR